MLSELGTWLMLLLGLFAAVAGSYVLWPAAWHTAMFPVRTKSLPMRTGDKLGEMLDLREARDRVKQAWLAKKSTRIMLVVALVLFGLLFSALGPLAIFIALPLGAIISMVLDGKARRGRVERLDGQVVEFLALMTQELDANQPMLDAMSAAQRVVTEPMASEAMRFLREAYSRPLVDAVAIATAQTDSLYWRRALRIILLNEKQSRSPKTQAMRIRRLTEILAGSIQGDKKIRGRLSAIRQQQQLVLFMLPAVFAMLCVVNLKQMSFFWTTTTGKLALGVMLAMMALVYWGVGRLLNHEEEQAVS